MPRRVHHQARRAPRDQRTWAGVVWDSKHEMLFAQECDLRQRAGELVEWIAQPKVLLVSGFVVRIDFLLVPAEQGAVVGDKRILCPFFVECKGAPTHELHTLIKLWREHGRLPLVIHYQGGTPEIVEGPVSNGST